MAQAVAAQAVVAEETMAEVVTVVQGDRAALALPIRVVVGVLEIAQLQSMVEQSAFHLAPSTLQKILNILFAQLSSAQLRLSSPHHHHRFRHHARL